MATGDQKNMVGRLRSALPSRWFPLTQTGQTAQTPVLDVILNAWSAAWAWFYSLYTYANLQTRISTSTDVFLDIASQDYLGTTTPRRIGEPDPNYSARIRANISAPRATRAGVSQVITALVGNTPTIFEPANVRDTGGYGWLGMTQGTNLAFGNVSGTVKGAGGWGSLALPYQAFIKVPAPTGGGIANVGGFYYGTGIGLFGYGTLTAPARGSGEFGSLVMSVGQITAAEIYDAIVDAMPEATIAWTAIG